MSPRSNLAEFLLLLQKSTEEVGGGGMCMSVPVYILFFLFFVVGFRGGGHLCLVCNLILKFLWVKTPLRYASTQHIISIRNYHCISSAKKTKNAYYKVWEAQFITLDLIETNEQFGTNEFIYIAWRLA